MAVNKRVTSISMPAGTDLSAAQFRIVKMESDGQVALATDGADPMIGILMNKPAAADRAAEVAIAGSEVKIEAGAALVTGDLVTAVAGGRGSAILGGTAAGTAYVVGVCTQPAGASAAIGGVLVNPFKYLKA